MGKQSHIVATLEDEEAFLRFVRETADIALFETHAPASRGRSQPALVALGHVWHTASQRR